MGKVHIPAAGIKPGLLTPNRKAGMMDVKNRVALRKEIERAINRVGAENASNTPDWILAEYLMQCLATFDAAVNAREKWYGRETKIPVIVEPS